MKISKATLLHIDCMQFMATLPSKAFDLAIVDPPYGIGEKLLRKGKTKRANTFNKHYETNLWVDIAPTQEYFDCLFRVSKNQIIWGGNYFSLPRCRGFIFWDKQNPVSNYSDGEYAWTSFDVPARKFVYGYTNVINYESRIHPTQKPIALYEWLLANYSKPGQLILDTHLGSGSSAIACNNFDFEMVGCELDGGYYRAAVARVEQASKQERLDIPSMIERPITQESLFV